jgi:peptidoglycan/LPS O-acetylase OafA/YrhL
VLAPRAEALGAGQDHSTAQSVSTSPPKLQFRPDIEALRGLAVLLVVCFHVGMPGFSGGFFGVDVFFVLSGYLITGILLSEMNESGRLDAVAFYGRRARRLLPAAFVTVLATLLMGAFLFAPLEQARLAKSAVATSVYAANLFFLRQSGDYFAAETKENPLLHMWSLSVEEQFYLVWPILVLVAWRMRRVVPALVVITVLSLAGYVLAYRVSDKWAFYGSPFRAWEFGIGALAVVLPISLERSAAWARRVGLGVLVLSACFLGDASGGYGLVALAPVCATALVLVAAQRAPGRVLAHKSLQRLGQLSYSWYLWHWPLLVFGGALIPLSVPTATLIALIALGLAAVTHWLIENPIRFDPRLVQRPRRSLVMAGGLVVMGVAASVVSLRAGNAAALTAEHRLFTEAAEPGRILNAAGCFSSLRSSAVVTCSLGDTTAARTVVVFGDSHAAQWVPALAEAGDSLHYRLVTMLKSSCPFVTVTVSSRRLGREFRECTEWRDAAIAKIRDLGPDLIIASGFTGWSRGASRESVRPEDWRAGTRLTLAKLNGLSTVVIRDTPYLGIDVPVCLSRAARQGRAQACAVERATAVDSAYHRAHVLGSAEFEQVHTWDFTDSFCDADWCPALLNGIVAYRDDNHMSERFALALSPLLSARISPLLALNER